MKINEIKISEENPRTIKDRKFKKLVQSIKDFPEMLELRPIVIDEKNIILGGNMRYRACMEAGIEEVPVKIAKGLTEKQKKEFIIKDNANFGDWDWDILGNEWNTYNLDDWGVEVWKNVDDSIKKINTMDEWVGMPTFEPKDNPFKIIVNFEKIEDREQFEKEFGIIIQQKLSKESNTWTTWWPFKERQDLKSLKFEKIKE